MAKPTAWCRYNEKTEKVAYWAHDKDVVKQSHEVGMGGDLPILPVYVGDAAIREAFMAGWNARVDDLSMLPWEWAEREFNAWQEKQASTA